MRSFQHNIVCLYYVVLSILHRSAFCTTLSFLPHVVLSHNIVLSAHFPPALHWYSTPGCRFWHNVVLFTTCSSYTELFFLNHVVPFYNTLFFLYWVVLSIPRCPFLQHIIISTLRCPFLLRCRTPTQHPHIYILRCPSTQRWRFYTTWSFPRHVVLFTLPCHFYTRCSFYITLSFLHYVVLLY